MVEHKLVRRLLGRDHFLVAGTLIEAWASMKSIRPKGFDVAAFIEELRERMVTPHIAVQDHLTKTGKRRKTKIYGRTTRHPGYGVSQPCRKRVEEVFGWAKTSAGLGKTKFRGKWRVDASFTLALAAYNLVRLPKLLAEMPP